MPASSEANLSELILTPNETTLAQLEQVWRQGLAVRLADSARDGIAAASTYLILASLNSTCLRTTGSYLLNESFSVFVRGFFLVT